MTNTCTYCEATRDNRAGLYCPKHLSADEKILETFNTLFHRINRINKEQRNKRIMDAQTARLKVTLERM